MVRPERFELPACCSGGNRSIQLSYGRAPLIIIGLLELMDTTLPLWQLVHPEQAKAYTLSNIHPTSKSHNLCNRLPPSIRF
jgi:hypothetical protein